LKADVLVGNAALVGDRRKFASVLLSPNFAALERWAQAQGIATTDHNALVADPRVIAAYAAIVERVNAGLAHFETMKRFYVVPEEWSIEDGSLTPSMKLKRRVVESRYAAQIEGFYAEQAVPKK
ncbi:MAG: long-chain fatty acid--CoA ligase, partial [Acidobacteriota bacterium]|nr:long-chain fatty acid--CoA ligase [Acidobacteriota bacterium]